MVRLLLVAEGFKKAVEVIKLYRTPLVSGTLRNRRLFDCNPLIYKDHELCFVFKSMTMFICRNSMLYKNKF